MTAKLSISIVIPVYNEEDQIKDCLDSIAMQTVVPDEVIVVDNNSTDSTAEIARTYPFVRVIKETNQGRGYARTTGFNAVKSDIIGRIDADSRISKNWVETALLRFENDDQITGLTGIGKTSFIPGVHSIKTTFFSHSYYWYVRAGFRTTTMWGATMAMRRYAWEQVSELVCNDDKLVHEDQDVSLWIASLGGKIVQDNNLKIVASGSDYMNIKKALHYRSLYISTKNMHKKNGNLSRFSHSSHNILTHLGGAIGVYFFGGLILVLSAILYVVRLPFSFLKKK